GFLPTVPRAFHLPRRIEDQLPAHSGDPRAQKSSPHHSLTALREREEAEARLDSQTAIVQHDRHSDERRLGSLGVQRQAEEHASEGELDNAVALWSWSGLNR
ncbi:hypothetical protein CHARACLAT_002447, partial [Characodon lateralis]|nr:hypothetical protein [Characodon lateralis]